MGFRIFSDVCFVTSMFWGYGGLNGCLIWPLLWLWLVGMGHQVIRYHLLTFDTNTTTTTIATTSTTTATTTTATTPFPPPLTTTPAATTKNLTIMCYVYLYSTSNSKSTSTCTPSSSTTTTATATATADGYCCCFAALLAHVLGALQNKNTIQMGQVGVAGIRFL